MITNVYFRNKVFIPRKITIINKFPANDRSISVRINRISSVSSVLKCVTKWIISLIKTISKRKVKLSDQNKMGLTTTWMQTLNFQ